MRLRRLDLARYGKFTDRSLDFGAAEPGRPDLHIVHGPNEAGKSTAFAAFLDLLFGIEPRSRFNFLHPYPAMRIGGALDLSGGTREFVRIKRPQNSLLDAREQVVSEAAILSDLGGIDRTAYQTMFSLDDATLEAGGESILSSKGDLGQLLFSASAGLADLGTSLVALKAQADGFYRYHARSGELPRLKAALADLKTQRDAVDIRATDYTKLVEERDRAGLAYEEAILARGTVQARIDEIGRQVFAWPRLAALRELKQRLAPLDTLPDAPLDWAKALPQLQADEIALGIRLQGATDAVTGLMREREAIVVDEAALRLTEAVERLGDPRARALTARKDIPERKLQLRESEVALSAVLARIDRAGDPDPQRLILPASVSGTLRELIETRSGVEAACRAALGEAELAQRRLDEAEAAFAQAGGESEATSLAAVETALGQARGIDHEARARRAHQALEAAQAGFAERLRGLWPWQGDAQTLAALPVPADHDIRRWRTTLVDVDARLARHDGEIERLTGRRIGLDSEIAAAAEIGGLVTDQDAAQIRAAREQAWALHRLALDASSAESFEATLRRDDVVTGRRLTAQADLARLRQASQALLIAKAELQHAIALRDEAAAAKARIEDEIATAVAKVLPEGHGLSLDAFEAWLARRQAALEAGAVMASAQAEAKAAAAELQDRRQALQAALARAGLAADDDTDLVELLALAQAALDRETRLATLRDALAERRRDLRQRGDEAHRAQADEQGWAQAWQAACAGCWLGEGGRVPTLPGVRETLQELAELRPLLERRAGLVDRIGKMELDQRAFRDEVVACAAAIGLAAEPSDDGFALAQRLTLRIDEARSAAQARAKIDLTLDAARATLQELAQAKAIHDRRKAQMTAFFDVETLPEVAAALAALEKRAELQAQADAARREVLDALRLGDIDEAQTLLDGADRASIDAELAALKARFEDLDQRSRDLFSSRSKARDAIEAVGGDGVVARIEEERRTLLLEIEDGALRYMRLRLGATAAEQALRLYRDRHRSAMMTRASQAFAAISQGRYSGLATQADKDAETLIAVAAGGGSKQAAELSKGTRFQLYLALRVAGYHEFVASRAAVPFIADDIMETFDDERAKETFRIFAEMAQVGQVIYLTHHPHLCDIARRVCPGVRVHELAG